MRSGDIVTRSMNSLIGIVRNRAWHSIELSFCATDNLSHEWMMKFIEHRVADRRILRLIQKWLKAGVSEDGQWSETKLGTPQGAVVSPLIANVYLHYLFDLWADVWRKKVAKGDIIVVRYADDLVVGFQHRTLRKSRMRRRARTDLVQQS
jgi:retron-type reverse transcriptase